MLKLFKEIRRAGEATIAYPDAPLDLPEGYRGKPAHAGQACIACGACAIACPPNAISMELDESQEHITWAINYGRCIFCGRCEEVCPTFAIKLSKEFELTVMSKADLEESCAYPVAVCARCGKPYASAKELDYARRVLAQAGGAGDAQAADGVQAADDVRGAQVAGAADGAQAAGDVRGAQADAFAAEAAVDKMSLCLECRRRDDGAAASLHAYARGGAR